MAIQVKQKSAFFAEEKHSKIFKALNPEKLGLLFDCEFVCLQACLFESCVDSVCYFHPHLLTLVSSFVAFQTVRDREEEEEEVCFDCYVVF